MLLLGDLDQVRTMEPVLLREAKLYWKVVKPVRRVSIMAATGMAVFLTLVNEISGTTPELLVVATDTAVPFNIAEAQDSRTKVGAIKQSGNDRISDCVAATQVSQVTSASPGQWLIDDIARARAKYVRTHKHKGLQRRSAESGKRLKFGRPSAYWDPLDVDWAWWYWQLY
jgi:hypothetical protein